MATNFSDKLVLNRFILSYLGFSKFKNLKDILSDDKLIHIEETEEVSKFCTALKPYTKNASDRLSSQQLIEYDENISRHLHAINQGDRDIKLKYFQYLTLLFTEIYLDKFFTSQESLLNELNVFLDEFNKSLVAKEKLSPFELKDLNKLAFWNATGSGKTLIMHINLLQFQHYSKNKIDINKTILITPNVGLSQQHLQEFETSKIDAMIFDKSKTSGIFSNKNIEIIEISKIKDDDGDATVAVDSFEDNNLVLIDEGHRGSSGDTWKTNREKLSENGFAFEYSATFGQAVAGNGKKEKELQQEYAKSIIFDYSYKYFYNDGYGKDYTILNLKDDNDENIKKNYFIASLLCFYQQAKIYQQNTNLAKEYNLENPLLVFVGSSVNSVRNESKQKVSDVVDIVLSFKDFIENIDSSKQIISNILAGKSGVLNADNEDLFYNRLSFLQSLDIDIYTDILKMLFNTSTTAKLYLDDFTNIDGEIGLRIGENDYFGVINVGDSNELIKLCDSNNISTDKKTFAKSLFANINDKKSKLNILIGSKKFTEGWNSWRVSSMGLLNMGKSEGSQIIQLFGRGMRLKGKDFCLKRSSAISTTTNDKLLPMETLNIFGVRANYMESFKQYLENEGVPVDNQREFVLKTVINQDYQKKGLKVLQLQKGRNYRKDVAQVNLEYSDKSAIAKKVSLNLYAKVDAMYSNQSISNTEVQLNEVKLTQEHLSFIDFDRVFFELQQFKKEHKWSNLSIDKNVIDNFIKNNDWYLLYAPSDYFAITKFSDYQKIEDIFIKLLKEYTRVFYNYKKASWESQYLEYRELNQEDDRANFIDSYYASIDKSEKSLIEVLEKLEQELPARISEVDQANFKGINLEHHHLYNPLFAKTKESFKSLKMRPTLLNDGEIKFLEDFKKYMKDKPQILENKEVYLLRNQSRTGVSLFVDSNFYPDFIMWIIDGEKQYINFIDPKGISRINVVDSPKLNLANTIKNYESKIGCKDTYLNSFILSVTKYNDLKENQKVASKEKLKDKNILFQEDRNTYIEDLFKKILNSNQTATKLS
ncbi:DEAD/DEAH box helicase family protein [Francisella tularensis]|uniref:DEAD/DEAH box helicase family protein n=1 Tax=Francisella tularensis TaxID=263 RepID=UPI0008F49690|nr:DEAD/DEAH box helicase family protein [Francisella tularensis]APA83528.1 hypothetical protein N894_1544 [Francisella tularensis subsp. novicida PA10-7858]